MIRITTISLIYNRLPSRYPFDPNRKMIYSPESCRDRRRYRVDKIKFLRAQHLNSDNSSDGTSNSDSESKVPTKEECRKIKNRISAMNSRKKRQDELEKQRVVIEKLQYENTMLRKLLEENNISCDNQWKVGNNNRMQCSKDVAVY